MSSPIPKALTSPLRIPAGERLGPLDRVHLPYFFTLFDLNLLKVATSLSTPPLSLPTSHGHQGLLGEAGI